MGQLIERLKNRLGVDSDSKEMRRAKVLASNDLEFLANLVDLRRSQNISQSELAEKLGISQATVAAFERSDNDPKLSTIRRYAHGVGALIVHKVALDEGQLMSDSVTEWDSARARRSEFTRVGSAVCTLSVDHSILFSPPAIRFAAAESKKSDFAPMA
ncbi:helix-turn-helix domain-containing protein [Pseudarthrobacter sp. NPDC092419]|uniref:helix-turn-helix domain-containing protein n=1 Tax=Pseudarthrobacter sp. NPDC092419 TaxID=3364414 RepID=UPI003808A126